MNSVRKIILALTLPLIAQGSFGMSVAHAFDMDCKVILCLAGGFPSGCADARSYMLNRLRKIPPKPPFGFCPMGNATGTTHVERGREPYLPCLDKFDSPPQYCDRGDICRPVCVATRPDYASARTLATYTQLPRCGTETRNSARDPRDSCVALIAPDREDGRNHYLVQYRAVRREHPNWIQIHFVGTGTPDYSSERFWWSR